MEAPRSGGGQSPSVLSGLGGVGEALLFLCRLPPGFFDFQEHPARRIPLLLEELRNLCLFFRDPAGDAEIQGKAPSEQHASLEIVELLHGKGVVLLVPVGRHGVAEQARQKQVRQPAPLFGAQLGFLGLDPRFKLSPLRPLGGLLLIRGKVAELDRDRLEPLFLEVEVLSGRQAKEPEKGAVHQCLPLFNFQKFSPGPEKAVAQLEQILLREIPLPFFQKFLGFLDRLFELLDRVGDEPTKLFVELGRLIKLFDRLDELLLEAIERRLLGFQAAVRSFDVGLELAEGVKGLVHGELDSRERPEAAQQF